MDILAFRNCMIYNPTWVLGKPSHCLWRQLHDETCITRKDRQKHLKDLLNWLTNRRLNVKKRTNNTFLSVKQEDKTTKSTWVARDLLPFGNWTDQVCDGTIRMRQIMWTNDMIRCSCVYNPWIMIKYGGYDGRMIYRNNGNKSRKEKHIYL